MSQHTPDAWIERNLDDPHDPYFRGGPPDPDEIFCEECPKCGEACNPDEMGNDGLCVNCTGTRLQRIKERLIMSRAWRILVSNPCAFVRLMLNKARR